MFLEATLGLTFKQVSKLVRTPAPTVTGQVLHWLTIGYASEQWEKEAFDPAQMIRSLAAGLRDAGLSNLVSAAADEEIVYLDKNQDDDDLEPILEGMAARIAENPDALVHLELVAEYRDEVGTFIVEVTAEQLHPQGRCPVRIRAYALIGALDVRNLDASGYRGATGSVLEAVERRVADLLRTPKAADSLVGSVKARLEQLCERIEAAVRARLDTYPEKAVVLCCAVRPRHRIEFGETRTTFEPHVTPVLRSYPGLPESAFYLRVWLDVLSQLRAEISGTALLDEVGHPIMYVGTEAAQLGTTQAYRPGQSIAGAPGALDIVYFAGHDYEDDLRAGSRIGSEERPLQGEPAWKQIRELEFGYCHRFAGADPMAAVADLGVRFRIERQNTPGFTEMG